MTARRGELVAAAALVAGVVVAWALTGTYPNYDSYYHLVWGRELLDGVTPSFEAYAAPTKHPLYIALAAVLGLAGEYADRLLVLVCLLSHAALILGTYRLGRAVFGTWPGILAAVFLAASASFWLYAMRGYVDMPFLALVVWAAVWVVEDARRGSLVSARGLATASAWRRISPFLALAAAGLLRPEAWVLGGLLWLHRGRRPRDLAWVLAAPVLWVLIDLVSTGDPLHSLNATSDLADHLNRERGLDEVPGSLVSFLSATLRPPVAALSLVGVALALWIGGWRRSLVPLGLVGAGVVTFIGTGVLGLSILPRYLTVPAVALCVFAGYALAGFTTLADSDPRRRRWMRASVVSGVLGAAVVAILAPSLSRVTEEVRFIRATHDELTEMLDVTEVRNALRCGPLTFPTYRLVPDARWHLDAPAAAVVSRARQQPGTGVAVVVLTDKGRRRFGYADGVPRSTNRLPAGWVHLAWRSRYFAAMRRC